MNAALSWAVAKSNAPRRSRRRRASLGRLATEGPR